MRGNKHEPFCPEDGTNFQEMLLEMTGQKTVPNVFVNKTHIGGCDKTMQVRKNSENKRDFLIDLVYLLV